MLVVADAAPLIFLGKLKQLSLIQQLWPGEILIPLAVRDEVLKPPLSPHEERTLLPFLQSCRIVEVDAPEVFARGLSVADNSVLSLALSRQADLLLSDDRLLRRLANGEGLRVIGTLGVLLAARKSKHLPPSQTVALLEELVQEHGFRIGIEVYNAALKEINTPQP